MNLKGTIKPVMCALLIILMLNGAASARFDIYNGDIDEGDGYQINNYVIDITDVFVEANTASYYIYNKNTKIKTGLLDVNETVEFDFEEDGKARMRLKSVHGGILPSATVEITLSNYERSDLFFNTHIEGGHKEAAYAGNPSLKITKEIDRNEVRIGDVITVTVNAENSGNDVSKDVMFTDPKQESFVLVKTTYEAADTVDEIDKGETIPVYIYELKATEAGTFKLKPVTARYKNSANQAYESSSNTPEISVEGAEAPKAQIETSVEVDSETVRKNEKIHTTFILKNTGDASAEGVRLELMVPEGLEYVDGDEEFELVGGNPKIYIEALQPNNDKEFSCTLKAKKTGNYTPKAKLSYEYEDGRELEEIEESEEIAFSDISVEKGKYDYLFELPIYAYILPLLLFAGVGLHIYRKHREYKF